MTNEIIVIKQLPIIEEHLKQLRADIEEQVADALSLAVTEETRAKVKAVRSELNKQRAELEEQRMAVKRAIMTPYEQFEAVYKENVYNIFKRADDELKRRIDEVENGLKEKTKTEIVAYFAELCAAKGIDFIAFEDTGAVVTLSASKKSLKEKVKAFVDKCADDLAMIDTQEHAAEILVEYKRSLNVSQAILTVNTRKKAIEDERNRQEQARLAREQRAATERRVEEAIAEEAIAAPIIAPAEEEIAEDEAGEELPYYPPKPSEKVCRVCFEAQGTLEQIRELKYYAIENIGVKLTQIKKENAYV